MMKVIIVFAALAVCVLAVPSEHRLFEHEEFRRNFTNRVDGGTDAKPGDIPWQGMVIVKKDPTDPHDYGVICGGATLISDTWAIIHGYCSNKNHDIDNLSIEFGGITTLTIEAGRIPYEIENIVPNNLNGPNVALAKIKPKPEPEPEPEPEDLVKLVEARIKPIKISKQEVVKDDSIRFSGVAATSTGYLQYLDRNVIENSVCETEWNTNEGGSRILIADTQFCTEKDVDKLKYHCYGDHGGPAVIYEDTPDPSDPADPKLVGIIDWVYGLSCGDGKPSPFYRIDKLIKFIEDNTDVVIE